MKNNWVDLDNEFKKNVTVLNSTDKMFFTVPVKLFLKMLIDLGFNTKFN